MRSWSSDVRSSTSRVSGLRSRWRSSMQSSRCTNPNPNLNPNPNPNRNPNVSPNQWQRHAAHIAEQHAVLHAEL